ncbi:MAG: enoyl-CoA hydratase/isomerase family protein [Actinomycetota bacterium]
MAASTNFGPIRYDVDDAIATITIDRPERLNAFDQAVFAGLNEAMARFKSDDEARVAILTASGDRAFSAGFDIKAGDQAVSGGGLGATNAFLLDFMDDDMGGKPVIFAGFGRCVGQGVSLAAWADLRIAADTTLFSVPEAKIGISAQSLPGQLVDLLGASVAHYFLLYGEDLTAEWARSVGFVHEVVPFDQLLPRARAVAASMIGQGPLALAAHKRILKAAMTRPRDEAIALAKELRRQTLRSNDFREGMRAFNERRPPDYTGT